VRLHLKLFPYSFDYIQNTNLLKPHLNVEIILGIKIINIDIKFQIRGILYMMQAPYLNIRCLLHGCYNKYFKQLSNCWKFYQEISLWPFMNVHKKVNHLGFIYATQLARQTDIFQIATIIVNYCCAVTSSNQMIIITRAQKKLFF